MSYRAWFQCINRAVREPPIRSTPSSISASSCDSLLEVQHDMQALAHRGRQGVDEALRGPLQEQRVALRLRRLGQEGMGPARRSTTTTSSRCTRAAPTSSGPSASARCIGVDDLWIKLCGNTHSGSFKDLGMTVLVSQVKQMITRGRADQGRRLRLHRRHLGGAGGLLRRRGHPVDRAPAAAARSRIAQLVQPIANGALVLVARHRLRRLHARGAGDHQGRDRSTWPTR
ncbi:MAG: hypothetical protein MZU97_08935 [Bacillus subtilis]|nr:hypothetical protein [Bacillus subtilis]